MSAISFSGGTCSLSSSPITVFVEPFGNGFQTVQPACCGLQDLETFL